MRIWESVTFLSKVVKKQQDSGILSKICFCSFSPGFCRYQPLWCGGKTVIKRSDGSPAYYIEKSHCVCPCTCAMSCCATKNSSCCPSCEPTLVPVKVRLELLLCGITFWQLLDHSSIAPSPHRENTCKVLTSCVHVHLLPVTKCGDER